MDTISVKLDIPESFTKDCEAYDISEQRMLQLFTSHLTTVCTFFENNDNLLIAQTTNVFKDFMETTIVVPESNEVKREICIKVTKTIIAMTVTGVLEWSEADYNQLINDTYQQLLQNNKNS